jgi:anti-anti-sigma factor
MALEIREERVGATCLLILGGRLDTETSADLELAVQDLLQAGDRRFVIDLAGVGYVSSAGLRVLLMLAKTVDGNGSLRLAALNPTVRQVFDVAGFTPLFVIHADRAAALGGEAKAAARSEPPATKATVSDDGLASKAAALLGGSESSMSGAKAAPELVKAAARALAGARKP